MDFYIVYAGKIKWLMMAAGHGKGGSEMTEQEKAENEKKKEYLKSYLPLVKAAKRLEEELEELRASKMFPSMGCDGMPHGSGGGDMSDYIIKLDAVMSRLIKARYARIERYSDIFTDIERMEDEQEKEVLSYRYLKGYNWEKICDLTGYSWKQMHRIHARALKNFKIGKDDIE